MLCVGLWQDGCARLQSSNRSNPAALEGSQNRQVQKYYNKKYQFNITLLGFDSLDQ